jgi:hypothetical protein
MMLCMKQTLLNSVCRAVTVVTLLLLLLLSPTVLLAQDAADKIYDARLEGYAEAGGNSNPINVTLESSSTATMWLLLIVMAALCVGVMFKNAKRTHLD